MSSSTETVTSSMACPVVIVGAEQERQEVRYVGGRRHGPEVEACTFNTCTTMGIAPMPSAAIVTPLIGPKRQASGTFFPSNWSVFPVVRGFDAVGPLEANAIGCIGTVSPTRIARGTLVCDQLAAFGTDGARYLRTLAALLAQAIKTLALPAPDQGGSIRNDVIHGQRLP